MRRHPTKIADQSPARLRAVASTKPRPNVIVRGAGAMAVIGALASWIPTAADATVVTGTFSGVVTTGVDPGGVFGTANGVLDGLSYVETFTYDTSKGSRGMVPGIDQVAAPPGAPVLTYSLTINGFTDALVLSEDSFVDAVDGHDFRLGGQAINAQISVFDIAYSSAAFSNLDHPVSFMDTVDGPGDPFPGFAYKNLPLSDGGFQYLIHFDTQRVDFVGGDASSGAPEPAAWTMMLTGFLAVAASLRMRRRTARGLSRALGRAADTRQSWATLSRA
jgi:hypothetical protein